MPIPELFDTIVGHHGERESVVSLHQNARLSYLQLAERVNTLARAFIAGGFNKGDRVGIWSPNNVEWLVTQYATAKAGIILVTINPAYRVHELSYVLEQSGCKGSCVRTDERIFGPSGPAVKQDGADRRSSVLEATGE